jgi:hypothetical protein
MRVCVRLELWALALDHDGNPHVSYVDATLDGIKYARKIRT